MEMAGERTQTIYEVVPTQSGWLVSADFERSKAFSDKVQALDWARERAKENRPSRLRVHGVTGRLLREETYGNGLSTKL
jgi:predicted alpha/beta-fold hydrolase